MLSRYSVRFISKLIRQPKLCRLQLAALSTESEPLKWSYVHGISNKPLLNKTVGEALLESTERFPDKEVFVFPLQQVRKTYAQFYEDAQKLASGLLALGLRRGDRVGMWGPNTYEWVVTQYATALAGMVLVTINPAYQVRELEFALRKVGISALISPYSFRTQDYYGMVVDCVPNLPSSQPGDLNSDKLPNLKHVIILGDEKHKYVPLVTNLFGETPMDQTRYNGAWTFNDVLGAGDSKSGNELKELMDSVQPDEPVNIQFTSGTTGSPKGATLSHFNILNNAYSLGSRGHITSESRLIVTPPLYHCYGCVGGSLSGVVMGATIVFPAPGFHAEFTLKAVHAEKGTHLYGTPTMYIDMLNHPNFSQYDYTSLGYGSMAGAPCPVEVCKQLIEKMHMEKFLIFYGSTETSPCSFSSLSTDPPDVRVKSVGRIMDHVEAKVVDHDGCVVKSGEKGELYVRGYVVMLGYWNDVEKTQEAVGPDRWYRTGDLAILDEEGLLKIVGRTKEIIIRGGENIYPTEIEQFLYTHPKVEDVQVVGVPDERMGEEVCAWIRLHKDVTATEQEIKDFCKGNLAHFKIPRYILFKSEKDFPLTITGKAQKFKMRDISTQELGLGHVSSQFASS